MDEGSPPSYGNGHVDGLRHLAQVGALFQASLGKGVDAVGTLNGMGYRKGDEAFLPLRELPFGEYSTIVVEELFPEL